jgi:hypothetical protein
MTLWFFQPISSAQPPQQPGRAAPVVSRSETRGVTLTQPWNQRKQAILYYCGFAWSFNILIIHDYAMYICRYIFIYLYCMIHYDLYINVILFINKISIDMIYVYIYRYDMIWFDTMWYDISESLRKSDVSLTEISDLSFPPVFFCPVFGHSGWMIIRSVCCLRTAGKSSPEYKWLMWLKQCHKPAIWESIL